MHPLGSLWYVNTGPKHSPEVEFSIICIRLDERGGRGSSVVWAVPGGLGWVYLAVQRPGCVLQSCGWRSCAYLRRRLVGWAARAGGKPVGRSVVAPPSQKPPRTTSSGTRRSLRGLQQTSLQLLCWEAGRSALHRTENVMTTHSWKLHIRNIQHTDIVWIYYSIWAFKKLNIHRDEKISPMAFKCILNLFTILLSYYPVEVETVDKGAHGVSRSVSHQTFIQHFLHKPNTQIVNFSKIQKCRQSLPNTTHQLQLYTKVKEHFYKARVSFFITRHDILTARCVCLYFDLTWDQ